MTVLPARRHASPRAMVQRFFLAVAAIDIFAILLGWAIFMAVARAAAGQ